MSLKSPANAGNIARLCAATGSDLHLIGRLGFSFRHPDARRAGMDYWEKVSLFRHLNYAEFLESIGAGRRVWAFTTKADRLIWDVEFRSDDLLLFGPESRGLPDDLLESLTQSIVRIPMVAEARSLNLASATAIGLYEAIRQTTGRRHRESRSGPVRGEALQRHPESVPKAPEWGFSGEDE